MNDTDTSQTPPVQDAILDAMDAANPDIEGDLMRKLTERGVDGPVREHLALLKGRDRRPRYVQGWRP